MINATATTTATATATNGPIIGQQIIDQWPGALLGYSIEKTEDIVVWVWHTLSGPGGCG